MTKNSASSVAFSDPHIDPEVLIKQIEFSGYDEYEDVQNYFKDMIRHFSNNER